MKRANYYRRTYGRTIPNYRKTSLSKFFEEALQSVSYNQLCDVIKMRDYPSLFQGVSFPLLILSLIFITPHCWFFRHFVKLFSCDPSESQEYNHIIECLNIFNLNLSELLTYKLNDPFSFPSLSKFKCIKYKSRAGHYLINETQNICWRYLEGRTPPIHLPSLENIFVIQTTTWLKWWRPFQSASILFCLYF